MSVLEPSLHDRTSMPDHRWYAVSHVSIEFPHSSHYRVLSVCEGGSPSSPSVCIEHAHTNVLVNSFPHSFPVLCNTLSYCMSVLCVDTVSPCCHLVYCSNWHVSCTIEFQIMVGSKTALHLLGVALSYNNWYVLYVYHNCMYYQCVHTVCLNQHQFLCCVLLTSCFVCMYLKW